MLLAFAQLRVGRPGRLPSPDEVERYRFSPEEEASIAYVRRLQVVGTPAAVRERIEELVQRTSADEVMLATHAYDPGQRFFSWIYRIAINEAMDAAGRRPRTDVAVDDLVSDAIGPQEVAVNGEADAGLQDALMALNPDQRTLIVLKHLQAKYGHGYTVKPS
jgi:DNA-directed RNA polymerase specialized sigma24 family protein